MSAVQPDEPDGSDGPQKIDQYQKISSHVWLATPDGVRHYVLETSAMVSSNNTTLSTRVDRIRFRDVNDVSYAGEAVYSFDRYTEESEYVKRMLMTFPNKSTGSGDRAAPLCAEVRDDLDAVTSSFQKCLVLWYYDKCHSDPSDPIGVDQVSSYVIPVSVYSDPDSGSEKIFGYVSSENGFVFND